MKILQKLIDLINKIIHIIWQKIRKLTLPKYKFTRSFVNKELHNLLFALIDLSNFEKPIKNYQEEFQKIFNSIVFATSNFQKIFKTSVEKEPYQSINSLLKWLKTSLKRINNILSEDSWAYLNDLKSLMAFTFENTFKCIIILEEGLNVKCKTCKGKDRTILFESKFNLKNIGYVESLGNIEKYMIKHLKKQK